MKVFAISDLHLSINNSKPMDIFGPVWDNYLDTIVEDWNKKVTDEDVVLLAGDLSWAMKLEDAVVDLEFLTKFPQVPSDGWLRADCSVYLDKKDQYLWLRTFFDF